MNTDMTHDTAAIQLRAAMLVRALGQPMVITPLTMMATATIAPGDAAGASGLFNVARNLGGSIGIALLQTFVEIREHFHFDAIAQHVTPARPMVQAALRSLALIAPGHSQARAVAQLAEQVRREATVLAYSDCFWIMGAGMLLAVVTVVFMRKPG
jgi:DHA2 family multidrug resistance protein